MLQSTTEDNTTYYFYGNGLTAQDDGTDYLTYHFNNVGSTMAVTDDKGNKIASYEYSPYGQIINRDQKEDGLTIPFLYNGQYGVTTDDSGLYYMRARYSNVDIRRFLNQDVLTGTLERTSSLNRYAYVEGNPLRYLEPFGLERTYVSETNKQHNFISDMSYILSCINITIPNPVTLVISITIGSYDIGLCIYDLSQYDPCSNEAIETWMNIGKDLAGLIPGGGNYITIALYLKEKYDEERNK